MRRYSRWLAVITGILLLLLLSSLGTKLYLKSKLEEQFGKSGSSPYVINMKSLEISLLNRSIITTGLDVIDRHHARRIFQADEASISGIGIINLLMKRKISVDDISVNNSILEIELDNETGDSLINDRNLLYDSFKDIYESVEVDKISISNISILGRKDNLIVQSALNGNLLFRNVRIDSAISIAGNRLFESENLEASFDYYVLHFYKNLYTLVLRDIRADSEKNQFIMKAINLLPNVNTFQFGYAAGKQSDCLTIKSGTVSVRGISIPDLLEKQSVNASLLNIDSLDVYAYRNKYVTDRKERKAFLQEHIKSLPIPVQIHELEFTNAKVVYEELLPPAKESGSVNFSDITGKIENLSNQEEDSLKPLLITATSRLFDTTPVSTSLTFPMNGNSLKGSLGFGKLEMGKLNSMLKSSTKVLITSGTIDTLSFRFNANKNQTRGRFEMTYQGFRVTPVDPVTGDTSGIARRVFGFIANSIIRNKNTDIPKKDRLVEIDRSYNNNKFFINNVWKSTLAGVIQSVGIKEPLVFLTD